MNRYWWTDWSTDVSATTIAFIGLGNIGGGAAANLTRAGHDVRVVDLDPAKVASLQQLGATAAPTPAEASRDADVVFTSLPGPPQLRRLAVDIPDDGEDQGILAALPSEAVWIDLSTNDLETARWLDERAAERGIRMVDAPVSGGPEGAQAGTLSIFVGAAAEDFADVRPLLDIIGAKVDRVGPRGAGIVAKIAQVTLCYTQTVTLIEALLLGVKGGVEPAMMLDLIQNSAGSSYCADVYGPEILAGTYDESFPISHAAKDMRLAMELAGTLGVDVPHMAAVAQLYERTEEEYGSTSAHLLAAQLLERANNLVLHEL